MLSMFAMYINTRHTFNQC